MPFLVRDNAQVYFEISLPEGADSAKLPWVTLINGHTRTSTDFRQMTRFLTERGFGVVTLDNRGCGKTVTPGPVSGQQMVDDVLAIWDQSGITQSAVLGISMGGMIAQHVIVGYPERVWAGILVSTTSDKAHVISSRTPWVPDLGQIKAKLERFFAPPFVARNGALIEAMAKGTLKAMEGGRFDQGVAQQTAAMASFADPALERVAAPVLVVHGSADTVVVPLAVDVFRQRIPHVDVRMYEDVGHLILAEAPQRLYQDVAEFLNRHVTP